MSLCTVGLRFFPPCRSPRAAEERQSAEFFEIGEVLEPSSRPLRRSHVVEPEHWRLDIAEGRRDPIWLRCVELEPGYTWPWAAKA